MKYVLYCLAQNNIRILYDLGKNHIIFFEKKYCTKNKYMV